MTGLLSDLKPQSGNWLEFQPGMLNCRQPAQKCIFAGESRASREKLSFANNTLLLSSVTSKLFSVVRQPVILDAEIRDCAKNSTKVREQTLTKVFPFCELLYM